MLKVLWCISFHLWIQLHDWKFLCNLYKPQCTTYMCVSSYVHSNEDGFELVFRHRAVNLFLQTYSRQWLETCENHTPTALSHQLLLHQDYLTSHHSNGTTLSPDHRDPLTQLFTMMKRMAIRGDWWVSPLYHTHTDISVVCTQTKLNGG